MDRQKRLNRHIFRRQDPFRIHKKEKFFSIHMTYVLLLADPLHLVVNGRSYFKEIGFVPIAVSTDSMHK